MSASLPIVQTKAPLSGQLKPQLTGKVGIEIELLAPPGASRETLANAIALLHNGSVLGQTHTRKKQDTE